MRNGVRGFERSFRHTKGDMDPAFRVKRAEWESSPGDEPLAQWGVLLRMSLQYRLRDMSEDRRWQQRVRLSSRRLLDAVDRWCRGDSEFPVDRITASVLHLFSPRCDPFCVPEHDVQSFLGEIVDTSATECSKTWPRRPDGQGSVLIDAISWILDDAVARWKEGSLDLPVEEVNERIMEEIVARQYVVFHHHQTTRRDQDRFYGTG